MRYQINILRKLLKTDFYKLIVLFYVFLFFMLIITFFSGMSSDLLQFESIISVLTKNNITFVGVLWLLFQLFLLIYISYNFYFFESDNSPEYVYLRTNRISLLLKKIIVLTIFVFLFRIINCTLLYLLFIKFNFFRLNSFVISISIYMIFTWVVFPFYVIKEIYDKKKA